MKKFKIVFYLLLVAFLSFLTCYCIIAFCTLELDICKWHVALRIITALIVTGASISLTGYKYDEDCN